MKSFGLKEKVKEGRSERKLCGFKHYMCGQIFILTHVLGNNMLTNQKLTSWTHGTHPSEDTKNSKTTQALAHVTLASNKLFKSVFQK